LASGRPLWRLYTSGQIESADVRDRLSEEVLDVLRGAYGLAVWGCFPGRDGQVYVQTDFSGGYDLWSVVDNGGEFNVAKVNHEDTTLRSVPYVDRFGIVDAGTVAYRVAMVVKGEEIDWDARWPELVDVARETMESGKTRLR